MEERTLEATSIFLDTPKSSLIRVLHVDDEEGLLRISKQLLPMEGDFQVETSSSVEEAMKKLGKVDFDVVVSDYKMPEKDGLDFLKQML
jgi:DNA-binding NtrC family response regulator